MPTSPNSASTSSQFPPSTGSNLPNSEWAAWAFKVASGIVFTVKRAELGIDSKRSSRPWLSVV